MICTVTRLNYFIVLIIRKMMCVSLNISTYFKLNALRLNFSSFYYRSKVTQKIMYNSEPKEKPIKNSKNILFVSISIKD